MQTPVARNRIRLRSPVRICAVAISCALSFGGGLLQAQENSIEEVLAETDDELLDMEQMIEAGEYALPQAWLSARVKKIQRSSHRYDPQLVRPLTLLGDIAAAQGDNTAALDYFGEALHIQRVSNGLVSAGQVEIVHREADVYRTLGNLKLANQREEYAYHVLRRAHDSYDKELLPGLYRLAHWYTATNNLFAAQDLYQQCLNILNANGQGASLEALPAMEGLVNVYRQARFPPVMSASESSITYSTGTSLQSQYDPSIRIGGLSEGEFLLQQIVQIRRDNGNDPVVVAEAVLDLADWYLMFDKYRRAQPLYDYAYDLLDATDGQDAASYFAKPKLLHFPAPVDPQPPSLTANREPQLGYVEVSFDVTSDGFIRSLETVDSNPSGMMDFRVRKSIRAARFRPALTDGAPVASENQTFRHEFTYYPAPGPETQETAATEAVQ
jgi:TonB family protein